MRHATVKALDCVFPWLPHGASDFEQRLACDWSRADVEGYFIDWRAEALLKGRKVALPTCPACATLLDLALEMRGAP